MDFPYDLTNPNKHIIGSLNSTGPLMDLAITTNNVATSGAVWPAANRALYQPVMVETWFLAQVMAVQVTATAAGNFDVGIFDSFGRKLVSMGSTAVGSVGLQTFNITDTWLPPGVYYLAMNCSTTTTVAVARTTPASALMCQLCGQQQSSEGSVALPTTATFANPASNYVPWIVTTGIAVI